MFMSNPPSSDAPLLAGLSAVVSAMIGFAILMYWAMQPTVLPNAPYETTAQASPAPIALRAQTLVVDIEQSAVTAAARENERQGLRPIVTAAAAEPAPAQALAQALPPKPAKPKRVAAKAPRRDAERTYANNWWGGGHSFFGGFGSWDR
jgi:hypothetical protein